MSGRRKGSKVKGKAILRRSERIARAAVTDIGNKTNILPASKNIQNKPAPGLTKQKATSTLQKVSEVTTRVTRQSLEKKEHELMVQDDGIDVRIVGSPPSSTNCSGPSRTRHSTTPSQTSKNIVDSSDEDNTEPIQTRKTSKKTPKRRKTALPNKAMPSSDRYIF